MIHKTNYAINSARFIPYEDFMGLGTSNGIETIAIPGAGLANYDSFVANPYITRKQRAEQEVHSLLEKLRPDMITLNPHVPGTVDKASQEVIEREFKEEQEAAAAERREKKKRSDKKTKKIERVHDKKTRDRIKD
jgi:U3 small nucleolar RNA-associated protein 7